MSADILLYSCDSGIHDGPNGRKYRTQTVSGVDDEAIAVALEKALDDGFYVRLDEAAGLVEPKETRRVAAALAKRHEPEADADADAETKAEAEPEAEAPAEPAPEPAAKPAPKPKKKFAKPAE